MNIVQCNLAKAHPSPGLPKSLLSDGHDPMVTSNDLQRPQPPLGLSYPTPILSKLNMDYPPMTSNGLSRPQATLDRNFFGHKILYSASTTIYVYMKQYRMGGGKHLNSPEYLFLSCPIW